MRNSRVVLLSGILAASFLGCTFGVESAVVSARVCERVNVCGPGISAVVQTRRTSAEVGMEALMFFDEGAVYEEYTESASLHNFYVGGNVEYGNRHRLLVGARLQRGHATHWLHQNDLWFRQAGWVDMSVARLGYGFQMKHVLWGIDVLWLHSIDALEDVSWFDQDSTMVRLRAVIFLK